MGAIAVSKKEEEQIERLRKELGIASKSALIRAALRTLEKKSQEEKLRRDIQDSVNRCGAADREENRDLFNAGVARANGNEQMPVKRGHLYIIDFNPRIKTKPGRLRPALVLQSDLVNEAEYPSAIVIPTTTRLVENPGILRFRLKKGQGGVSRDSDLLLGQVIAVANESFRQEIGSLSNPMMEEVENRIRIILSL